MSDTTGFGAPTEYGTHHFYVEIPPSNRDAVSIFEDFGFEGDESTRETTVCRLVLARSLWTRIRDEARRDFNPRLKQKKIRAGSWKTGTIKLDRFLGRELCVLGWAAEHATPEECAVICQKWLALRPEERWWLFAKTAAEAGADGQKDRGWRKALYCALSDARGIRLKTGVKPRRKKKKGAEQEPSLFKFLADEGIE